MRIFIHIYKAKRNARNHSQIKRNEFDLKFSIGLFMSIILYVFTFCPFMIILMIDFEDTLPGAYRRHGLILARINSCLNPLLYGLTNTIFRKGFENFYFFLFNRKEYSFSIEVKEKKILNEKLLLQELKSKKLNTIKKKEENLDINDELNILNI